MTKVTIDAALFTKLVGVREVAQLCDSAGRLVGFFHPGPPRDKNGNVILPFSEEELHRRRPLHQRQPRTRVLELLLSTSMPSAPPVLITGRADPQRGESGRHAADNRAAW